VRSAEHETFTTDGDLKAQLERDHVKLIGYRPIRELQRKLRKESHGK
jgi:hypothetical protein